MDSSWAPDKSGSKSEPNHSQQDTPPSSCSSMGLIHWLWMAGVVHVLVLLALVIGFWFGYWVSAGPMILEVDGHRLSYRTHQKRVGAFLDEIGLALNPKDIIVPSPEQPLSAGETVKVIRALPFFLEVDGGRQLVFSHASTIGDLFHEAGIRLSDRDVVLMNGVEVSSQMTIRAPEEELQSAPKGIPMGVISPRLPSRPDPTRLSLRRAIPMVIHNGALAQEMVTTSGTVGEALMEHGIILYLGDQVNPAVGTRVHAGLHIFIKRSTPVSILADQRLIHTRTQASTVGDLLLQEGIALWGIDRVEPAEESPLHENQVVRVVRVREETNTEQESIPFETIWQPNAELEIDHQSLRQAGLEGLAKSRIRISFEDGEEIERVIEEAWIDREPETKIIDYGTKIVIRQLETPEGTVSYWRKIRALATSYTSATSGKARNHPQFGITFLGWQMRHGIIAVDPTVINLRSEMYVPGYGHGVAGDTGGAIKGQRIDLGYEEDNLLLWYRWVDVYLLTPAPPASQIRWVLPSWPREPGR